MAKAKWQNDEDVISSWNEYCRYFAADLTTKQIGTNYQPYQRDGDKSWKDGTVVKKVLQMTISRLGDIIIWWGNKNIKQGVIGIKHKINKYLSFIYLSI